MFNFANTWKYTTIFGCLLISFFLKKRKKEMNPVISLHSLLNIYIPFLAPGSSAVKIKSSSVSTISILGRKTRLIKLEPDDVSTETAFPNELKSLLSFGAGPYRSVTSLSNMDSKSSH